MTRETEAATYLRGDATLMALIPGGVYPDGGLTVAGITNPILTPKVWDGGTFKACIIVRGAVDVPQYRVYDAPTRTVDTAQRLEHYLYALTAAELVSISARLFYLSQEHRFTDAFGAQYRPGLPIMDAPGLTEVGVQMQRDDYLITSLRSAGVMA